VKSYCAYLKKALGEKTVLETSWFKSELSESGFEEFKFFLKEKQDSTKERELHSRVPLQEYCEFLDKRIHEKIILDYKDGNYLLRTTSSKVLNKELDDAQFVAIGKFAKTIEGLPARKTGASIYTF
jgi:hypothetical protein